LCKYTKLEFSEVIRKIPKFDLSTQQLIVSKLDAQMQVLEGLRKMKAEAEKKINQILADV